MPALTNFETQDEKRDHCVSSYEKLCSIPSIGSGILYKAVGSENSCEKEISASVVWSRNDLVNNCKRKFAVEYNCYEKNNTGLDNWKTVQSQPSQIENVILQSTSPCGEKTAIIRENKKDEKEKSYLIEVWTQTNLLFSVPTSSTLHGAIYTDSRFGCLSWSNDGKKIAYCAEKKPPTHRHFWDTQPAKEGAKTGEKFIYEQDWGELYENRFCSRLFVLNVDSKSIQEVKGIPLDVAVGDAQWSPCGKFLIFCGVPIPERRLGLIYCFNRKHGLYSIEFNENFNEEEGKNVKMEYLTKDFFGSRSPRVRDNKVIFLYNNECTTHNTCHCLGLLDWETKTITTVIDSVIKPSGGEFPGIFSLTLPIRCWLDDDAILFTTQWQSRSAVALVNIKSKIIQRLDCFDVNLSYAVFDTFENYILLSASSPSLPTRVLLVKVLSHDGNVYKYESKYLSDSIKMDLNWSVITIPVGQESESFEIIVSTPTNSNDKKDQKFPLVVFPHGGPHSCYSTAFSVNVAYLCSLGYIVCLVNYRGSTGFGLGFLESLVGKVGRQDVDDVQTARNYCCENLSVDNSRVAFIGGSHGGWLGAHSITQFPDYYQACVLHNPVINLVENVSTTDIPDWCYSVSGIKFKSHLHAEDIENFYQRSPISKDFSKVKTPTILKIGGKDKRVPPSQGIQFHNALRENGVFSKVFWYPEDSHPIDKVESNGDSWVHIALFFDKYLNERI